MALKLASVIPQPLLAKLRLQKYHIVGRHSAVKKCLWLHNALTRREFCYKCLFYGIASHRCIQMTPAVVWCWHNCLHCWRVQPADLGIEFNELVLPVVDDPELIVEGSIRAQLRILTGYKAHPKVDRRMWEEACRPKHVAISLAGEPALYPRLGELIEEYHRRGFTTFLVTRGVRPDVLASIPEPSQLYVSVDAPDEDLYKKMNRPLVPRGWQLIQKTLELLPSFTCPTVIRITVVKGLNLERVREMKRIIELAQPTYVEVKAYMHVGYSTRRLTREHMPSHEEVVKAARELAEEVGYYVAGESRPSRVVLLSSVKKPIRVGEGCSRS